MKTLYLGGEYASRVPDFHSGSCAWKANHILKMLRRNNLEPDTICEIGCGSGEILHELSKKLTKKTIFVGYDISPQAIKMCHKISKKNIKFFQKDIILENGIFYNTLMCIDVIEHVEDYIGFLKGIKNKGKFMIFHFPLELSVLTVLRGSPLLRGRKLVGHLHYFTKDTALATLEDTGYQLIDYFYTPTLIDMQHNNKYTKLLKLPRKFLFAINKDLAVRILGGFSLLVLAK